MSAVNEIAQWVVLVFLSVFVLGLTRQLGGYITATREQKAENEGPRLGTLIPDSLISPLERERLTTLMRDRKVRWAGLVVMSEECPGCAQFLREVEQEGLPEGAPLVLLLPDATDEHRARLERLADLVVLDEKRIKRSNVTATPFAMVVDEDYRLVEKAIGPSFEAMVDRWREADASGDLRRDGPISIVRGDRRD